MIILGIIILYILIAIITFVVLSKIDFYKEYKYNCYCDFPSETFVTSIFWIIMLPYTGISHLCEYIGGEIAMFGRIIYERNKMKKKIKKEGEK